MKGLWLLELVIWLEDLTDQMNDALIKSKRIEMKHRILRNLNISRFFMSKNVKHKQLRYPMSQLKKHFNVTSNTDLTKYQWISQGWNIYLFAFLPQHSFTSLIKYALKWKWHMENFFKSTLSLMSQLKLGFHYKRYCHWEGFLLNEDSIIHEDSDNDKNLFFNRHL